MTVVRKCLIAVALLAPAPAFAAGEAPRLFACVKPDNDWADGIPKKECLAMRGRKGTRGRWLPKGDDMPIKGKRI